ncbi:endonuclease V [Thermosipho melanesiensis]|uniref:Endonuclease V n=2 Tax=Thermosipho melanesiensis TaxID=46541 RepID=NFI_THEM4|nr:endonuclease V [Thermosipho melanesiensis]A6LNA6.1 RecName: Full=Endonuclease V; AltName: Full=Deoxyinosine 3'endonuclease; AltName: Full=Deoxyribonuclease V; Short=DNase V [Thermosipho melanesiensis BI429]ABR31407.1 Deoxyribonuclease V [Thermosipho melanesiensis BI429]APT74466.1 endonuclease V [Thermosipho melanesiensis]OOC36426.1 endonuclease V [Thermosipho melanesiensis]OOC37244.1 endonuclease V [Thermosipho melanesiensis]OOC37996.1 endonuclease V [Thermosipho melanesiensis]
MEYKKLHSWKLIPEKAIELQKLLSKKLTFKPLSKEINLVAGVDLSFVKDYGLAVIVILDKNMELIKVYHHIEKITFPYIPGLLAFREGPIFLKAWKKVNHNVDVVFFDGHGISHPRSMGIASHMGLWIEQPTIGIAKKILFGNYVEPENKKFSFTYITYKNQKIGIVLRSRENVKPIFISPGNLITLDESLELTKQFITKYKLPEPTRLAHKYSQLLKKQFNEELQ